MQKVAAPRIQKKKKELRHLILLQKLHEWFNSQQDRSRTPRIQRKFLRDFILHFSQFFRFFFFRSGDM